MKEIPILFSTDMVQAILAGRKTQTRRLVKFPLKCPTHHISIGECDTAPPTTWAKWNPGDLLWVRENFRVNSWDPEDGEIDFRYEADGELSGGIGFDEEAFNKYWIKSCDELEKAGIKINPDTECYEGYPYDALKLRPNIFLPKEAARIWLQVEEIRVERLHDISEDDAMAEGVAYKVYTGGAFYQTYTMDEIYDECCAKDSFSTLWEKINGKESLKSNPWVWVVKFKVLSTTGKPALPTCSKCGRVLTPATNWKGVSCGDNPCACDKAILTDCGAVFPGDPCHTALVESGSYDLNDLRDVSSFS